MFTEYLRQILPLLFLFMIESSIAASIYDGQWSISEQDDATACGEGIINRNYLADVSTDHNNQMTVTANNITRSGTLIDNQLDFSVSYPEDGGTTEANGTLVFNDTTISGNTSWTWSGGGERCSGTSTLNGTLLISTFQTPTPVVTPTPTATPSSTPTPSSDPADMIEPPNDINITDDQGDAIVATPISIHTTHTDIPLSSSIITDQDDKITLVDESNIQLTINPNSLTTIHPEEIINNVDIKKVTLLKGSLDIQIPPVKKEHRVVTPLATIIVSSQSTTKRSDENIRYTIDYSQDGLDGDLSISVTNGSVSIIDRHGMIETLSVGKEFKIHQSVNRSHWVLPIDGDFLYSKKENTLCWLAYPNAKAYILEYNFPTPYFSESNPSRPEYLKQAIYFYPKDYKVWQGLVIAFINIPDIAGQLTEARIFALDLNNNILSESVASDKGIFMIK